MFVCHLGSAGPLPSDLCVDISYLITILVYISYISTLDVIFTVKLTTPLEDLVFTSSLTSPKPAKTMTVRCYFLCLEKAFPAADLTSSGQQIHTYKGAFYLSSSYHIPYWRCPLLICPGLHMLVGLPFCLYTQEKSECKWWHRSIKSSLFLKVNKRIKELKPSICIGMGKMCVCKVW